MVLPTSRSGLPSSFRSTAVVVPVAARLMRSLGTMFPPRGTEVNVPPPLP